MIKFLEQARKGRAIDLRITSNFSDLKSGKIKIVSENAESIPLIRSLLEDSGCLSSPDDLSTSEGKHSGHSAQAV